MNFNSSHHDQLYSHHSFLPNPTCHFFFDPNSAQDHAAFYDHHHHHQHQLYRPTDHAPDDENYGGSACDEMKREVESGLKLGVWRKAEEDEAQGKSNPIKWMSSKMRVMQKMKHSDHGSSAHQKVPSLSSVDADSSSSYSNSPIRVCSDCNTTKTPLWRSGPKGPKSLCNACGIRQRKARRAMAAAAAANNGVTANASDQSAVKMKLQHNKVKLAKSGHASHESQLKKRCKTAAGSEEKQLGFEDFLINLSKNLAFHRVFPDDEKDAAILLMALSSGLVNG